MIINYLIHIWICLVIYPDPKEEGHTDIIRVERLIRGHGSKIYSVVHNYVSYIRIHVTFRIRGSKIRIQSKNKKEGNRHIPGLKINPGPGKED